MAIGSTRSATAASGTSSSATHLSEKLPLEPVLPGHGESALPEDKLEEAIENLEDDWENDPQNARNWSFGQKWTAVAIVRPFSFV